MEIDNHQTNSYSPGRISRPPKVSIGFPVYNGEKFIRRALDSLLGQSFTDFELIISDNASTDLTRQICLDYAQQDKRIRYLRNEAKIAAVFNFNHTLQLATGQYFMWAAHDDKWDPSFLATMVQSLNNNPQAALAFCRFVNVDDEGVVARTFNTDWKKVFSRSKFWQFAYMTLTDEISTQRANHIYGLMRREVLVKYGGMAHFPDVDYSGEDILTLLRLLSDWEFVIQDQILFYYRARSFTTRTNEPLAGYLWQRMTQVKPNHQGNLILFFKRNHAFHSNMRDLVAKEKSLLISERLLLWLALIFKEVWFPVSFLPAAVLRELRILR